MIYIWILEGLTLMITKNNIPNDILEEYGLFAYHEYLVTGKITEVKEK